MRELLFLFLLIAATGCHTAPKSGLDSHPAASSKIPPPTAQSSAISLTPAQQCRVYLHKLDGAKQVWAVENRKVDADVPTDSDLFGPGKYMPEKPKCPSGGIYTLGAVDENPRCSTPGHPF